jgi:hypothetical protein
MKDYFIMIYFFFGFFSVVDLPLSFPSTFSSISPIAKNERLLHHDLFFFVLLSCRSSSILSLNLLFHFTHRHELVERPRLD